MCSSFAGVLILLPIAIAGAGPADETPAPFAPLEHMVGAWKGTATPAANKVKGWSESHAWAWKFENGKPVAMTVEWQGDKALAKGLLTYSAAEQKFHLDGTDLGGKAIAYLGTFSPDGKSLALDRAGGAKAEPKERLVIRPNANKIRYTLQIDRQEAGAPQFKRLVEVGLTKVGESFAAGSGGDNLPKCIMTGGAAGMTVSYQGKTYPVCCSGCRDEFNDHPEKYARKADAAAQAAPTPQAGAKPAAGKGKDDGSFDGLIEDSKPKKPE